MTRVSLDHFFGQVSGESHRNDDGSDCQAIIPRCRVGELLVLEREPDNPHDINAIRVIRQSGEQIGYLEAGTLTVVGMGDKQRECTVVPRLRGILRAYVAHVWPAIVGGRYGSPYLFTRTGQHCARIRAHLPLLTRLIYWILKHQVSPVVGRRVHTHMLRHSFASRLRENGAPLELIQDALGHANIGTTLIYAHVSTKKQRADIARYLEGGA
jgi:integrase